MTGEIARAWGNDRFGSLAPRDELIEAATRHDDGWLEWERTPTLDRRTGLPSAFHAIPPRDHPAIHLRSAELLADDQPYASLVVSIGRLRLVRASGRLAALSAPAHLRVHRFRRESARLQAELRTRLGVLDESNLARDVALVRIWDQLSLDLLLGRLPSAHAGAPTSEGNVTLRTASTADAYTVDPWPFGEGRLHIGVTGRLLRTRFDDATAMRAALEEADTVSVDYALTPAN